MENKTERESGIELLRIFAICGIIGHHILFHGILNQYGIGLNGVLYQSGPRINKLFVSFLFPGGDVGNAVFFMVSGYFLFSRTQMSFRPFQKILIQTHFHTLLLFCVSCIGIKTGTIVIEQGGYTLYKWLIDYLIIPVTGGQWWFISAYVILLLCGAFINAGLERIKYPAVSLCVGLLLLFATKIDGSQFYGIYRALYFYCIGAMIRKEQIRLPNGPICLIGAISAWFICGVRWWIGQNRLISPRQNIALELLYTILATGCAMLLVGAFSSFHFTNTTINKLAGSTLAVYILHDNFISRQILWRGIFHIDKLYLNTLFPIITFGIIISVFIVCTLIDKLREVIFCLFKKNRINI